MILRVVLAGAVAGVVTLGLAACTEPQQEPRDTPRQSANSDRYSRDRELCRAQADADTKTRRNIDDSRREVFRGDQDRYGQSQLPDQMAAYGEVRTADRLIADCMEARGWPQPQKAWWQKIAR